MPPRKTNRKPTPAPEPEPAAPEPVETKPPFLFREPEWEPLIRQKVKAGILREQAVEIVKRQTDEDLPNARALLAAAIS